MDLSYVATDTETTGLFVRHGARPFIVSTTDSEKNFTKLWEVDVDPFTRVPAWTVDHKKAIVRRLEGTIPVFHNASFDIAQLASIGIYLRFPSDVWPKELLPENFPVDPEFAKPRFVAECAGFDETVLASHVCHNFGAGVLEPIHALKPLALKYLDEPEDDEKALQDLVRTYAKKGGFADKNGWAVGRSPKKTSEGEFVREWRYDYWMPRAVDPLCDAAAVYAEGDTARRTLPLWIFFRSIMEDEPSFLKSYDEEKQLLPILYAMENQGMTYSRFRMRRLLQSLTKKRMRHLKICKTIGAAISGNQCFNPNSPDQQANLLFGHRIDAKGKVQEVPNHFGLLPTQYTPKGKISTSGDALIPLAIEAFLSRNLPQKQTRAKLPSRSRLVSALSDVGISKVWQPNRLACRYLVSERRASKYETGINYLAGYAQMALPYAPDPAFAVMYPSLNQTGTKLTRLSSSNPNGQNITDNKKIPLRSVFGPPRGMVWLSIDYKQLELRLFAAAAGDVKMQEAFSSGYDFHGFVASQLYDKPMEKLSHDERRSAKYINFGLIYGAGPSKVDSLGGPGTYNAYRGQFPAAAAFMGETISFVRKTGYVVTLSGRRLYVQRGKEYAGVNAVIQGTAGELIKFAMRRIVRRRLLDWVRSRIVMQIHDELIVQLPDDYSASTVRAICEEMEEAGTDLGVTTPVDASLITEHWGKKESIQL